MPRLLARSLRGTSLGDDTLDAEVRAEQTDLLRQILASHRRVESAQSRWFDGDLFWKRVGIIATVSIPLSAAIWRALGVGRKKKRK